MRASTAVTLLAAFATGLSGSQPATAASASLDLREVCEAATVLTPVGVDTAAESLLLAAPDTTGTAPGWLIELGVEERSAVLYPDRSRGERLGGSTGPGPVLSGQRCGEGCLRLGRWDRGRWEPVGASLVTSPNATLHATWDRGGAPWAVLHTLGEEPGTVTASAYRFEGGEWSDRGALRVAAVGSPGVEPFPGEERAVASGTGRFRADGPPEAWVSGLPDLPSERRGQIIALAAGEAAYLTADLGLLLTSDGGRTWRRSLWTPWASGERARPWRPIEDYWMELPAGIAGPPLALLWADRRVPGQERLVLTEAAAGGPFRILVEAPPGILTATGERLPYNHVVRFDSGRWLLLAGCAATPSGIGLAYRTAGPEGLSPIRFARLTPGW